MRGDGKYGDGLTMEQRIARIEQRLGAAVPFPPGDGYSFTSDTSQTGGVAWTPAAGSYVASMYVANSGSPTQTLNGDYQKLGSGGGTLTWVSEIDKRPAGVSAQVDTATNKRLDVRATGLYDVKWSVIFASLGDGKACGAAIYKNGTQVAQSNHYPGAAGNPFIHGSKVLSLTAGDYLDLRAFQNESASEAYNVGSAHFNYIQMVFLGPA